MAEQGHPALGKPATRLDMREQLVELLQAALQPVREYPPEPPEGKNQHNLLVRAQALIETQIRAGSIFTVPGLADQLNVNERVLYKSFKTCMGISPYAWSHLVRMHKFRRHAAQSQIIHGTVTKSALESGFNHLSNFSVQFKRHFGETPRDFLRRCSSLNNLSHRIPRLRACSAGPD